MGSSRLPGKALAQVAGWPMLRHVLARAQAIHGVDDVVLATTTLERDAPLVDLAHDAGVRVVRGSEADVLGRFVRASTGADVVMRLTGDCPLLAPDVCEAVLAEWLMRRDGFCSNDTRYSGYPDGTDCEVFSRADLLRAAAEASHPSDREHVTRWMYRRVHPVTMVCARGDWRRLKWSVDTPEDLAYVRRVMGLIPAGSYTLPATLRAALREVA